MYKKGDDYSEYSGPSEGLLQLFLAGLSGMKKLDYLELKDEQANITLTRWYTVNEQEQYQSSS